MRTIETKVYSFEELSEQAKVKAIEAVRSSYYEWNEFMEWAIDDCALLEPPQKELEEVIGNSYDFPLLKNNRKVYCSLDRDRYIDISNAMEVTNDTHFLTWLGLKEQLRKKINYTIREDSIEFNYYEDLTEEEEECLSEATSKFEDHCSEILNRIEADYEYRFTDEAVIDDILSNEWEFLENGSKF